MEKPINFNLDNVLQIHQNLTEEEKSFSEFYISISNLASYFI